MPVGFRELWADFFSLSFFRFFLVVLPARPLCGDYSLAYSYQRTMVAYFTFLLGFRLCAWKTMCWRRYIGTTGWDPLVGMAGAGAVTECLNTLPE